MTPSQIALDMLRFSKCNISKRAVGACVLAENRHGQSKFFGGCNIELATSKVWHAEEVALTKAISEGYTLPIVCWITSDNPEQRAAMCGYCMQHFMYANPSCVIRVVNPDGSIKIDITVAERNGEYGYWGTGRLEA